MAYTGSKYIEDDYLNIAQGIAKGASHIHKFGANFDVDTGSDPETVWTGGGLYPWSAFDTAGVLVVTSSSSQDDVGGTGATEILVEGLNENYELVTETFTMDGTSNVTGTQTFKRVFRAFVTKGGTNGENVGTITISRGGTTVAQIDADRGQTLMTVYTIPAGYNGYLLSMDATINALRDMQLFFKQRPVGGVFRIAHMAEIRGFYRYDFKVPIKFTEKTDIDVVVDDVNISNSRITANFDLILIKK